jgi:tRNA threonylcarbamoyladenosine biosynthesis protein TsaE
MIAFGEHIANSEEETVRLGEKIALELRAGDILGFVGNLGAGKTTMIKAIAKALGADERETASPSFALVHDYGLVDNQLSGSSTRVYHIDLFRLESGEIEQLGLWEILDETNICLVEWADKFPDVIPKGSVRIEVNRIGEKKRKINISKWDPDEE